MIEKVFTDLFFKISFSGNIKIIDEGLPIFIYFFACLLSSQLGGDLANEIKHDHSSVFSETLDMINHTSPLYTYNHRILLLPFVPSRQI